MKKLVTILLALAMLFTMSITAFADEPATTKVNIENSTGREYVGYQLMDVSIGIKTDHDPNCTGNPHADTCYNYSYTITTDEYRQILRAEVFAYAAEAFWNGKMPATADGVTDKQIEDYLRTLDSDSNGTFGTLRRVADRIYRAILAAGLTPITVNSGDKLVQGYWIIAEATDPDTLGVDDSISLAMLDTVGQQEITFKPKTGYPTVTKKVQDTNDSQDADITDNNWEDSADHDIGDTVPFKLTITMPNNLRAYILRDADGKSINPYTLVMHDTMAEGLTLNKTSVKVYMYETSHKAETNAAYQYDVTEFFDVKDTDLTDGCTFEIFCDDIFDMGDASKALTPSTVFVVTYNAELNQAAKIGKVGNPNTVYLEYTNDPYSDSTGDTEESTVIVYTYSIVVNKVDSQNNPLAGAGFTLSKQDITGAYVELGAPTIDATGTKFTWTGLDDGEYKLVESEVPDGYNQMAPMEFAITANHADAANFSLDGEIFGADDNSDGILEQNIVNNTGAALPETGGMGTVLFIAGGMMLVAMAAVFMITRKKMSIYED